MDNSDPLKFWAQRVQAYQRQTEFFRLRVEAYRQQLEEHQMTLALPETLRLLARLRNQRP